MTHKIKVTFHANDGTNRSFTANMKSINDAERFANEFENAGGFKRLVVDILGDTDNPSLPYVTCSERGFKKVYNQLYPKSKLTLDK